MIVDIDDESWQHIALAMYESIGISTLTAGQPDAPTHLERSGYAPAVEIGVDLYIVESKYSNGDSAFLIVSYGDELSFAIYHSHYVALADTFVDASDGTREHPRMKATEALILTTFQIYCPIHTD